MGYTYKMVGYHGVDAIGYMSTMKGCHGLHINEQEVPWVTHQR
jgi:hypothetical protein